MKNRINLLLIIILISFIGTAQTNRAKIKSENVKETNYIKTNDFYLTHHLYIDLFLRESLLVDAAKEEVSFVINAIKKYASLESPLVLEINKSAQNNYLITVVLIKKDNKEILALYTNWNPELKKFEEQITDDSYTRWYYINNDKLTYRKDMSVEKDYSNLSGSQLANAYLFDELPANDSKIEELIDDKVVNENSNLEDYIYSQLVLLKYYIFSKNENRVKEKVDYLRTKFAEHKEESKLIGLEAAFKTTLFQIELLN